MPGTYIAVRVHEESESKIREFMERNKIPVVYPKLERRRHVTLVSSDDGFMHKFVPKTAQVYCAFPEGFDIFPTKEGNRCLVLRLNCPELIARHHEICKTYGCIDRYPEYKCHVSLSYDIGDMSIDNLEKFAAPILLGDEYCEEFNLNWVDKK
jgi:hypothetical protein